MAITKSAKTLVMDNISIATDASAYSSPFDVSDAVAVAVSVLASNLSGTATGTLTVEIFGIDSASETSENLPLYTAVFTDPTDPWFIVFELDCLAVHGVILKITNNTDTTINFYGWMSKTTI